MGYRYFAEKAANKLGIRGYVKNLWDGSVEIYAIGNDSDLEAFRQRLREGPVAARVAEIEESEEAVRSDYQRFVVEYL